MTSNPLLLLGLVGLALVCVGLFVVAFIVLFRFAGEHSVEFFTVLARGAKEDEDKSPTYIPSPKPDLRSIAEANDFDSALARQMVHQPPAPEPPPDSPPRLGSRTNGHLNISPRADDDMLPDLSDDQ